MPLPFRALAGLALLFAGSLSGQEPARLVVTVQWEGDLPEIRPLTIPESFKERHPEDASHCEKCIREGKLLNEELLVCPETRGIANVAASLRGAEPASGEPASPFLLDNRDGRFSPRVQFIARGGRLAVANSDPFTHNARIAGRGGRPLWNGIIPPEGKAETLPFQIPGLYTVHCDMHPWMKAYLIVAAHGAVATSDSRGRLEIARLAPGPARTFDFWHEKLGRAQLILDLPAGGTVERTLDQKSFR